jgi:hypothetical protein
LFSSPPSPQSSGNTFDIGRFSEIIKNIENGANIDIYAIFAAFPLLFSNADPSPRFPRGVHTKLLNLPNTDPPTHRPADTLLPTRRHASADALLPTRRPADTPTRRHVSAAVLLLILSTPSFYIFLTLPPLWRDWDGFNEIVSTFAPRGIVHWLPGYCLGGRLIVFAGSIVASLPGGHGVPHLSIDATPLSDAGIGTLIVVQHLFLILSLFYVVRTLSAHFPIRVLFAVVFALTPWLYVYANCIGSEAFSNPLVYLIGACGWNCLRTADLGKRTIFLYFGLLLAAALTRQINGLLIAVLPIALLPLAAKELILPNTGANLSNPPSQFRYARRFLIFGLLGLSAIGTSLLVQQTMCWLFQVPFRSTFGETFSYRLSYLDTLPEQQRTAILARISVQLDDPVVTEALAALNRSLTQGDKWTDRFLSNKIDEILLRSGFNEPQQRTWQTDLKLNRIATCVLLSGESNFLEVVWASFVLSPFFTQTDLSAAPFEVTDMLRTQVGYPMYGRLRGLATFQHEEGYYEAAWRRIPYVHLFERIPMLEMACLAIGFASVFAGLALIGFLRNPTTAAGASYAAGMILVGFLVSFATCISTYFQARLYLPVYSLFQMGMLLTVSMGANVLLEYWQPWRGQLRAEINRWNLPG